MTRTLSNDGSSRVASPRAARLFRSVVASSGLLLVGCGSAVVSARAPEPALTTDASAATDAPSETPDGAPETDVPAVTKPPAPDVPAAQDVPSAPSVMTPRDAMTLVDAALEDARSQEIGWPTTKGVFCWSDDAGGVACCRSSDDNGTPTHCCTPRDGACRPCMVDDAGRCALTDAAVEAGR